MPPKPSSYQGVMVTWDPEPGMGNKTPIYKPVMLGGRAPRGHQWVDLKPTAHIGCPMRARAFLSLTFSDETASENKTLNTLSTNRGSIANDLTSASARKVLSYSLALTGTTWK